LEAAQIWRELASHYFLVNRFVGSSDLGGTGSTLFSSGLVWRQLRFGGCWLHIIFQRIGLEAAQVWRELAPHYFLVDCFGGSSDLAGTESTSLSGGLFWRQLRFGGNWLHIILQQIVLEAAQIWRDWLHIIFRQIVSEAAQIWRELAPHYFSAVCFWRQLRFGGNWLHIIYRQIVLEAAQIWRGLAPYYFPADCFGGSSDLAGTGFT
jgi:hypothetical protein